MRQISTYLFLCALCLMGSWAANYFYVDAGISDDLIIQISRRTTEQMLIVEKEAEEFSKKEKWESAYPFFLMKGSRIVRWTDNSFLPDLSLFQPRLRGWKELNHSQGIYLAYGKELSGGLRVIGLLPIYRSFKVNNRYLQPQWNAAVFGDEKLNLLPSSHAKGKPVTLRGHTFFRIDALQTVYRAGPAIAVIALGALSILFFLLALAYIFRRQHRKQKYFQALFILLAGHIAVRLAMLFADFPGHWWHSPVFSPEAFASSAFNHSMGDFLLNALIFLFPVFYLFQISAKLRWRVLSQYSRAARICFAGALFFAGYAGILIPYLMMQTILRYSNIVLDINFFLSSDATTCAAFAALLSGTVIGFLACHLAVQRISRSGICSADILLSLFIDVIIILLFFFITEEEFFITLGAGTVYFVLLVVTGLYRTTRVSGVFSVVYLLLAFAAFSFQFALALKHFYLESQRKSQQRLAVALLAKNDEEAEYLLRDALKNICGDAYIQAFMSAPLFARKTVRQKIKQVYLSHYFDRYNININFFNANGEPQDEESRRQFQEASMTQLGEKSTPYPDIYLMLKDPNSFKQYQGSVSVYHQGALQGYVMLDLRIKKVIPKRVYPELLTDTRFSQFGGDEQLNYALYADHHWITAFGEYRYEQEFDERNFADSALYKSGVHEDNFFHFAASDGTNTLIVSGKEYNWSYVPVAFSFAYLAGLCFLFVGLLWRGAAHFLKERQLPYSDRIQIFTFVLPAVPLLVLGLSVLSQMEDAAEAQIREAYEVKSASLGEAVAAVLENPEFKSNQPDELTLLAKSSDTDFSVYDTLGYLKVASQPMIYETQLVSELINPRAFLAIRERRIPHVFEGESIGSLRYSNSYRQLKSAATGRTTGVLSIPFFESQSSFEKTRKSVFVRVLITFTFVLIIFLFLSVMAARWLSHPLRWITEILRRTSLRENKKMVWKGRDEIGVMVNAYNTLVDKLELSKSELARSQKEKAWREIAQQVAHEIKNPLTPIKLLLQQMEKQLNRNEFQEKKGLQSISHILSQVEVLDEIASSFSSFAKMPSPVLERVELTGLVSQTVSLYVNDARGKVCLICPYSELYCLGDSRLLVQIFSNLVLNALQSGSNGGVEVAVEVKQAGEEAVVSVSDNGDGIAADAQQRIFLPHFTTKKTGSGLGLAICKQGMEQMNGRIWFTSEEHAGTSFYAALPMAPGLMTNG